MDKIKTDKEYLEYLGYKNFLISRGQIVEEQLQDKLDLYYQSNNFASKGIWIPTYSGNILFLNNPTPDKISIIDIARGLSRIPRYNGTTLGNLVYTVAQHSSLCKKYIKNKKLQKQALLHDSQEAYCLDIITPIKKIIGNKYAEFEDKFKYCIAEKFNIKWDYNIEKQVKEIDREVLCAEGEDLCPNGVVLTDSIVRRRIPKIRALSQQIAFKNFMKDFYDLFPSGKD